jgi:hypothetical protein
MSRRLLLLAGVFAVSCGGSGGSSGSVGAGRLARLGITDARALFVAGDANPYPLVRASTPATPAKLYKITADGEVLEVSQTCTTDDGKKEGTCTTAYTARGVLPAGRDYVYVWFTSGDSVLVSKADGRAFLTNGLGLPTNAFSTSLASSPFQADAAGNIYFVAQADGPAYHAGAIVRIDVTDPTHLVATAVTPETDGAYAFAVNGAGDVIYYLDVARPGSRARTTAGAIVDIPTDPASGLVWVGLDGQFYQSHVWWTNSMTTVVHGDIVRMDFAGTSLVTTQTASWSGAPSGLIPTEPFGGLPIVMGGSLFFIGYGAINMDRIIEVTGPSAAPVVYAQPPNTAGLVGASPSALWFAGKNAAGLPAYFYRWTRTETTQVLAPDTYDIVSASVGADDTVSFTALRLADGIKVLAHVDAAGTVTILDEGDAAKAVALVPID